MLWRWEAWTPTAQLSDEVGREVEYTGRGEQCQETSVRNALHSCRSATVLGASDYLVSSKGDLRAYREFEQLVEIAVANSGKIEPSLGRVALLPSRSVLELSEDSWWASVVHVVGRV